MKRGYCILGLFLILFACGLSDIWATTTTVHYTYGGNIKALVNIPNTAATTHPVIIYNYDEFYDWAGPQISKAQGYDLDQFIAVFEKWGFITIIPLERYRKLRALQGAIAYANAMPEADKNEIHIIGLSEGAFLSLLSVNDMPSVKSITLIAPQTINYTGHFSLPELMKELKTFDIPVLLIVGANDKKWRLKMVQVLYRILKQEKKNITYIEYYCDNKWFRNPENAYMLEIYKFITKKKYKEKITI